MADNSSIVKRCPKIVILENDVAKIIQHKTGH